jgi:hypothetical protein
MSQLSSLLVDERDCDAAGLAGLLTARFRPAAAVSGSAATAVPVHCATEPFVSVVPGGHANTPPAGPIAIAELGAAAGEQPLPSDAASNSAASGLPVTLSVLNIVTVTQF